MPRLLAKQRHLGAASPVSQAEKDLLGLTGAEALDIGRGALANAAEVPRKVAASAEMTGRQKTGPVRREGGADRNQ